MSRTDALLFCAVWLCLAHQSTAQFCDRVDGKPSCVCQTSKGTIDLTSLVSSEHSPTFTVIEEVDPKYEFSYNPCYGFSNGACGAGTAICQLNTETDKTFLIALANTEQIVLEGSTAFAEYTGGLEGRTAVVNLVCDLSAASPVFRAYGDSDTPFNYRFDLTTKCACPNACGDVPLSGGTAAGGVGIALMVLFVVGVALYFIVGMLVMKYYFHKEGSDIVPQKEFWMLLPFLIKDGCVFVFGPLISMVKQRSFSKADYSTL